MVDCHIHMVLDGVNWKDAIARHKAAPQEALIRQTLGHYQALGFSYLRDGGDRWGVCDLAAKLAPEYGIRYRSPGFPIYKTGHYGGFIGRGFDGLAEYRALVREAKTRGAHFIKLMISGLMDFSQYGVLTGEPLPPDLIRDMIACAHDEGFSVMAHSNGDEAVRIRYFCVPCKPTKANGGRTRNLPEHDREKWGRFKAYNLLPIDRVFSVDGFGTVVTGTLIEGAVTVGDDAAIMPDGLECRVRNLQVHGSDVKTAYAGQRVAMNLAGIKKSDITRGDTIAKPGSMRVSLMLDVRLQNLKNSQRTIVNGSQVHLYHGSAVRLSKVVLLDRDALQPGESAYAQLRLTEEIATRQGDRFVVRFYSPLETIGGGVILDDHPYRHKRNDAQVLQMLAVKESGSDSDKLVQRFEE